MEKEQKEMEECSFAPNIKRFKGKRGTQAQHIIIDSSMGQNDQKNPNENFEEYSKPPRDINTFIAD